MKKLMASFGAVAVWAVLALPASAGWDNVFQPTLFERWRQPTSTSSYYVAPATVVQYQPAPVVVAQPPATGRSGASVALHHLPVAAAATAVLDQLRAAAYYQPVTVMQTQTVQEAVTTMRTSYYYEPVTSYRYSMYVDPCSGCAQQVATPTVAYQLKAQSSPVQTWVSRCVQVPVTVQQKVDYWQPQTTCCQTTQGAPIYSASPPQSPQPPLIQSSPGAPQGDAPSIRPEGAAPKGTMYQQYYPPLEKIPGNGASFQPSLGTPVPGVAECSPGAARQAQPDCRQSEFGRRRPGRPQRQHAQGQRQGALHQRLLWQTRDDHDQQRRPLPARTPRRQLARLPARRRRPARLLQPRGRERRPVAASEPGEPQQLMLQSPANDQGAAHEVSGRTQQAVYPLTLCCSLC